MLLTPPGPAFPGSSCLRNRLSLAATGESFRVFLKQFRPEALDLEAQGHRPAAGHPLCGLRQPALRPGARGQRAPWEEHTEPYQGLGPVEL